MAAPRTDHSGFFVLRTPLLPVAAFRQWTGALAACEALASVESNEGEVDAAIAADRVRLRAGLRTWLENAAVRDAIHVASPDLDAALHYWYDDPDGERGLRVERSLVRYLSRMASRPTPFGLFAGVSVGTVGKTTNLALAPTADYKRLTRLDTAYLARLTDALTADAELSSRLRYRPNDTLYRTAGRWRYVEWRRDSSPIGSGKFWERTHHLVAIDDSPAVRATIERASQGRGATIEALAGALVTDSITHERARAFVETLIENQVLRPDIQLNVTGELPLTAIENAVRGYEATEIANQLRAVRETIDAIDADGIGATADQYDEVAASLATLPAEIDRGHLFHVDLAKPAPSATIGPAVTRELLAGSELLRRIGRHGNPDLDQFRAAFTARYETRAVPLLEVLDDEIGIGFPVGTSHRSDAESLLAGLVFPSRGEATVPWGKREATLLRLLTEALAAAHHEIELSAADIEALTVRDAPPLADAFSVMATLVASSGPTVDRGDFRILFHSANGPSGAQLLGRFCYAAPELGEHLRRHVRAEEALHPDAVFAEIVHAAQPRAGNIVGRPVLRDHEISYMGGSGAPADRQIPASDLVVTVVGDDIQLWSTRLGKRVLPRLASAHVFNFKSVSVYRFLGALQLQGVSGGAWSWGPLAQSAFVPRVRHGRIVLSLARWTVFRPELEALGKQSGAALLRTVAAWRHERRIPRVVNLADADNTLVVDLENVLSVESFVQLVRNRDFVVLDESYPSDEELCVHGPEGAFRHELIVPFVRSGVESRRLTTNAHVAATTISRRYAPGSDWVYVKLYTGAATADRVLASVVAPLVRRARDEQWIDGWFFIRYADPDPHLRVRFHGDPSALRSALLPALAELTAAELETGRVWRSQLDTYEREVERYGGNDGLLLSERIFEVDSDAALAIAELSASNRLPASDRWRVALAGAEMLLTALGLGAGERRSLVESLRDSYRREHGLDAPYSRQISDRFRKERDRVVALFGEAEAAPPLVSRGARAALDVLHTRSNALRSAREELQALAGGGRLTVSVADFAGSHVHMSVVRQLRSAVRAQEAVIYDFLARLHADPRFSAASLQGFG